MKFEPTPEQKAARDATLSLGEGEVLALNACAGSGKTTTTSYVASEAHAVNGWRAIYICYNRDMAEAAQGRLPPSVQCVTVHSLAYRAVGFRFKHKLGNLRPRDVMEWLRCGADDARAAVAAVNHFLCSEETEITADHVIEACGDDDSDVRSLARRLWSRMCDAADPVTMTHDGYLKLWVLSDPDLSGIDLILVDEAQDLNPVILQLVLGLVGKGARADFVGDTNQALYGWRLAIDAMREVAKIAEHNLTLTESWRFPQIVADMATKLLQTHKGSNLRFVGRGNGKPDLSVPSHCTIARTNAQLIAAAAEVAHGRNRLHFAATKVGDKFNPFGPYRFQEMLDVYALYSGAGRPQSPHIAAFKSYRDLSAYAKGEDVDVKDPDPELAPLVEFVDRYGRDVPLLLNDLASRACGPMETDHHFSTAHRAKGKEWNRVTVLDGFLPLDDRAKLLKWQDEHTEREFNEAVNLLYVAITRGRCGFAPPESSAQFFHEITRLRPFQPPGRARLLV